MVILKAIVILFLKIICRYTFFLLVAYFEVKMLHEKGFIGGAQPNNYVIIFITHINFWSSFNTIK